MNHEHMLHSLFIFRTQPYISMDYANKLWLKYGFSSHNNGQSVRSWFKIQQKNSMDCLTGNASYSFLTAFMIKKSNIFNLLTFISYHVPDQFKIECHSLTFVAMVFEMLSLCSKQNLAGNLSNADAHKT